MKSTSVTQRKLLKIVTEKPSSEQFKKSKILLKIMVQFLMKNIDA